MLGDRSARTAGLGGLLPSACDMMDRILSLFLKTLCWAPRGDDQAETTHLLPALRTIPQAMNGAANTHLHRVSTNASEAAAPMPPIATPPPAQAFASRAAAGPPASPTVLPNSGFGMQGAAEARPWTEAGSSSGSSAPSAAAAIAAQQRKDQQARYAGQGGFATGAFAVAATAGSRLGAGTNNGTGAGAGGQAQPSIGPVGPAAGQAGSANPAAALPRVAELPTLGDLQSYLEQVRGQQQWQVGSSCSTSGPAQGAVAGGAQCRAWRAPAIRNATHFFGVMGTVSWTSAALRRFLSLRLGHWRMHLLVAFTSLSQP